MHLMMFMFQEYLHKFRTKKSVHFFRESLMNLPDKNKNQSFTIDSNLALRHVLQALDNRLNVYNLCFKAM